LFSDAELAAMDMDWTNYHQMMTREWKNLKPWTQTGFVPMQFNRFITYPTCFFHSRFPFEAFGTGPEDGRLIWICFYDIEGKPMSAISVAQDWRSPAALVLRQHRFRRASVPAQRRVRHRLKAEAIQHGYDLQHQDNQAALSFQKQQYNTAQKNFAPWLQSGTGAINALWSDLKAGKYGDWTGQFTAPTAAEAQQDPGYQFRVSEGLKGIDRGAAARGGILTGGTLKAEQQFGQDMASQEYDKVYGRRFGEYLQKFGEFQSNNTNRFNRYASIAGVGQQAANSSAQVGQQAAGNVTNILSNDGSNALNAYSNIGSARALWLHRRRERMDWSNQRTDQLSASTCSTRRSTSR
jgi:hypothetical protein